MKKSMKNIALASIAGLMFLPLAAQAACYKNGPIVRVTQYDDAYTTTGCYIYMRTSALSNIFFYARSNDDNTCTNAVIATTSGVDAGLSADAATCPTSGYMGVVRYLNINP